jgi:TRAP-type C4-dicarboxylate transport system substrate-binding protein
VDFEELCAKRGLHLYIWAVNGWHDFGSKTKGLAEVAAFAGVKAHMQETDVQRALWTSLKAVPVPLAVPDVLNGLQRGMVDTYSTTPIYASASQWITQTKHWTDSNHVYQPAVVVFDKKWWDGLSPELRATANGFAAELQAAARKDVRGLDEDLMEELRANGVTVHPLRADERKALMEATSGVAEKLMEEKVFDRALYEKITAALAAYRAKSEKP